MAAYSFLDVAATIIGPNGTFSLSATSTAPAKEGITVTKAPKNTMTVGADGSGMQSMHADESGAVTVRLLKTSPVNAQLSLMYQGDKQSSSVWGQNVIEVRNVATGDLYICTQGAFRKFPDNTYAEVGNVLEWEFDFVFVDPLLGTGIPSIAG